MRINFSNISKLGIGCVFDLDGTLIDSRMQIIAAVNLVRSRQKFREANANWISDRIGLSARTLFEDLDIDEAQNNLLVREFRMNLSQSIDAGNTIFPGVIDFLEFARKLDIPMAVASNKPDDLLLQVLKVSGLVGFFQHIQGTTNFKPKPDSGIITECMIRMGTKSVFMIGDRVEDMLSINELPDSEGIGIASGSHTREMLISSGACKVYDDFESLYLDFKSEEELCN